MESYVGTPEFQMRDLTTQFDSSSLLQGVSDKLEAKRAQRSWTELTSAIEVAKLLQDAAQTRLDLLSSQEREVAKATLAEAQKTWPGMPSKSKEYTEDLNKTALMARENRVYLQRCIRTESEQVAMYARQVDRLQSLLEDNMAKYKAAQYLLSQKGLPVELWRRIFHLSLIHERGQRSLVLSQICRFWRTVSIAYPELWAHILVESKSTRQAMMEFERFLERTTTSHCLYLNFRPSILRFRISAFDIEVTTSLVRHVPHNVSGQDSAYEMHDLRYIDSLDLDGSGNTSNPSVFLTSWGIRYLHCRDILPVLSPSVADNITKLTFNFRKWPNSFKLEQLLRLTFALEELNLNCRHNTGVQSMPSDFVILPRLRCLRTTVEVLCFNLTALAQSPYLRRIGIYPTQPTPPVFAGLWHQIETSFPRLKQSINHVEIHTTSGTTFDFQLGCFFYLGLFKGLQTLELRGPASSDILGMLNTPLEGDMEQMRREAITRSSEIIIRDCDIKSAFLMGLVIPTKRDGETRPTLSIKTVTLDRCTGLTRLECEELASKLEKLTIFQ